MAPPSTHDHKPPPSAYDKIIQVKIGKGQATRPFHVHNGLLSFYSGYFAAALKSEWRKDQQRRLILHEEDPNTFEAFQYWLYQQSIPETLGDEQERYADLIKLWVLGDGKSNFGPLTAVIHWQAIGRTN